MTCRIAYEKVSLWLDGLLGADERRELDRHLETCNLCALRAHQLDTLKSSLAELPLVKPPAELNTSLLVVASRARSERLNHLNPASSLRHWRDKAQLWMSNLMRPLAVPVAGGVLTALLMFAMLAPMYVIQDPFGLADVPTVLTTRAALKSSISFGLRDGDVVVDVLVDGQGRMIDYSIPVDLTTPGISKELRKCIENTLLCTQFTPATMFGLPKSSRLRFTLRGNQMDVIG